MSINILCQKCKSSLKLSSKKCTKCKTTVPTRNKKYRVVVSHKRKRKTKVVDNLEIARDIEKSMKTDIIRGAFDIRNRQSSITLDEAWSKILPWLRENIKTWKNDEYNYNTHLKPSLGSKPLDKISAFDIEALIIRMKKSENKRGQPYAAATIKHQLVLLSKIYNKALQWDLYSGLNPCKQIKKPKLNNQIVRYLNDEELSRLVSVLDKWDNRMSAGFVLFLLYTGLRRGELFKLIWDDIDMQEQLVTLKDPKGKQNQTLPLSSKAIEVLNNLPRAYDTLWIFYGKNGKQRTDFKGPWLRIKKAAQLPDNFRLHDIRHHFASSLVSNGVDLYTVQTLLTHKDASTTQRYAHLSNKALRDAVNLSDQLHQKNTNSIELKDQKNG